MSSADDRCPAVIVTGGRGIPDAHDAVQAAPQKTALPLAGEG